MAEKKLKIYHQKRDFSVSHEPKGKGSSGIKSGLHFVVQKHAASHLHYDFRLEIGGVLKSWAVPRGPSLNTHDKRLAVETEDHPLEYQSFEGRIPAGQYGAGTVKIWDKGTYKSMSDQSTLSEDFKKGQLTILLKGKKLKGGFALHRFKNGKSPTWLLIKLKDKYAEEKNKDQEKND